MRRQKYEDEAIEYEVREVARDIFILLASNGTAVAEQCDIEEEELNPEDYVSREEFSKAVLENAAHSLAAGALVLARAWVRTGMSADTAHETEITVRVPHPDTVDAYTQTGAKS